MYLIRKIINKCENSNNDWKRGVSGRRTIQIQQSDYDKFGKTALVEEAKDLEKQGLIVIEKWITRGSDIDRVAFRVENLSLFYEYLKENGEDNIWPKQEKVDYYAAILKTELKNGISKVWIRAYYEYLISRIERGNFPKDLDRMELYIPCFREIDGLKEPVYKRIFSKKVLKNSKAFEREVEKHVIAVARKYWEDIEDGMDNKEVLNQLFIIEYAQELEIKGPLQIKVRKDDKEIVLNMGDFLYGTVLNSATMEQCEILEKQPDIRKIITIENKANFVSAPFDAHTLYIFSHGYFSPKEREFLRRLEQILKKDEIEYYHSGDLDFGGISIYKYIKTKIFPEVKPYMMDVDTFNKYFEYAEAEDTETLEKLRNVNVPELEELKNKILETGMVIEQESFLI